MTEKKPLMIPSYVSNTMPEEIGEKGSGQFQKKIHSSWELFPDIATNKHPWFDSEIVKICGDV